MNNSIDETLFLCERVMAELCDEFDDRFGGEWDYDLDTNSRTLDLTHNNKKVGATMTVESVHPLVVQGVDEVQVYKMYAQAWGRLLPEANSNLQRMG